MLFLFDLKLRGTRPLLVHFHYICSSISVDLHYLCFLQLVNHVYFSPDGQWVASASFDKSVKLWNGITGTFVAAFLRPCWASLSNKVGIVFPMSFVLYPISEKIILIYITTVVSQLVC